MRRAIRQWKNSIPDVNVITNHKLVLVLDQLGESGHLVAPAVDGHTGVLGSLKLECQRVGAVADATLLLTKACEVVR